MIKWELLLCPVCGNKTRLKLREDTIMVAKLACLLLIK